MRTALPGRIPTPLSPSSTTFPSAVTTPRSGRSWKLLLLTCILGWLLPSTAETAANKYLDMDLTQLMEVTITSVAKKPQLLADAAAAIFVISQEDIHRSGVTSIPEALALAPGLQVARISSSKWSVSARGFAGYTSNKLLVMIDGRSVYTPAFSGTFWDMQHTLLEDIDRIEVIRGPGGTLWGANAVNGVINIITKKAQETQGGLLRLGAGNQDKFTAGARYGTKINDHTFARLYLSADDRDSNILAASQEDGYDGWQNLQTGFRMDGEEEASSQWTLQGDLFKNQGDQIIAPFWIDRPPYATVNYCTQSAEGGNLTGSWQRSSNNGDRLTLKSYYDYTHREESTYTQTFQILDLDLQYETELGPRNSLTMGAGFRRIHGSFSTSFQIRIPDQTKDLYSVFLQDQISLLPERLWLTLGSKYEHNDYTGSEWQPSGRLLWKPAEQHSIWASLARAVRTPSMVEYGGAFTVGAYPTPLGTGRVQFVGNQEIGSEELLAYEAGYRWQATSQLFLDLALYYNDYDQIYGTVPRRDPPDLNQVWSGNLEGEGYGLELALNWQASRALALTLTYGYQELNLEEKGIPEAGADGVDLSEVTTPRHQASLRASLDLNEQWQLNGWLRYLDQIQGSTSLAHNTLSPIPSHILLDLNLIWKPREDLELMLVGQNLLNSSQLQYITELVTPPTEIERSVYAKISWCF
ncbi:TonB-dependent receptor plug domain-containing protein [Desulfogranum mediterraneum]|uniref:TonB-dependent receptor plug domain-containing protein n=1 Tax=Desulfogranum mediterraneum TaxID=160661 RepID=UPI0003F54C3A|nr:TonB-dependent receptor [Desulfogranum mediterraneum]